MKIQRSFLLLLGLVPIFPAGSAAKEVNDRHSALNPTQVRSIEFPTSTRAVQALVRKARKQGSKISITGAQHAMGGQQFGTDTLLINTSKMDRVLGLDRKRGLVEVEAGIQWPKLLKDLHERQKGTSPTWTFRQKQTGADRLSIGGALSANAHGRGLRWKPFIQDVESFLLVDPQGDLLRCSRGENQELFDLVIGGYGLFGVITSVELRLMPRVKLERVVDLKDSKGLMGEFDKRIEQGFLYGDWQYSTDPTSAEFLDRGIFSFYRPVPDDTPMPATHKELKAEDWENLYWLAHVDKGKAWKTYSAYYRGTSGQIYWSDDHQMSVYLDDYHKRLDGKLGGTVTGSEMISELYVPRNRLGRFLSRSRDFLKRQKADVIYGTVRLIEKDDESFLAWAKRPYACVIFNLHVDHSEAGIQKAQQDFRGLIDIALSMDGSYFLTYHRWARKDQVLKAYPQFVEFLRLKRRYDPTEVFESDWYRHYREMFKADLAVPR